MFEDIEKEKRPDLSDDKYHFKSDKLVESFGSHFFDKIIEYDLILSDSSTCTSDKIKNTVNQFHEDKHGTKFQGALNERNHQGNYWPLWGKGLPQMLDAIKWFENNGDKIENIAIICAGNDIKYGKDHCAEALKEIYKYNVEIFDVIPRSEFHKTWKNQKWELHEESNIKENKSSNSEKTDDEKWKCNICNSNEWSEIWGQCANCLRPKEEHQNKIIEISDDRINDLLMKQFYAFQRDKTGKLNPPKSNLYWKALKEGYQRLTN